MACGRADNLKKGQSSLEFLYASGLVLCIFAVMLAIFHVAGSDADSLGAYSEALRACSETAAQISSVAAAGDGASAVLARPKLAETRNYSLYISGKNRQLTVGYAEKSAGCMFATSNITNGTSDGFYFEFGAAARNIGGGVVIG